MNVSREAWAKDIRGGFVCAVLAVLAGCAPARPPALRGLEVMREESRPELLADRGEAFASLGDMTRAEQYFVAAMRAGGDGPRLVRRLVAVCVADGRYPVALAYAEEHLRTHPGETDLRFAVAALRAALRDVSGARDAYTRVLAVAPSNAEAHYALAQLEADAGDAVAADRSYRAYLALAPDGQHAEVARANLLQTVPR